MRYIILLYILVRIEAPAWTYILLGLSFAIKFGYRLAMMDDIPDPCEDIEN